MTEVIRKTESNYISIPYTKEIQDNLSGNFDCGNEALTAFLKSNEALDNAIGKTFVCLDNNNTIVGYYNISTGDIKDNSDVRIGGAVYINYFAMNTVYQQYRLNNHNTNNHTTYASDMLLADCLNRINDIREDKLGFAFVTLSSTDEGLYLYERNGFYPLEEHMRISRNHGEKTCSPMYLPIDYE
jgi:hypothetical protein